MAHELVTHARHEAAHLGGQLRELLAWWLGISFGVLSAGLGLLVAAWPATMRLWPGVLVGMWLLTLALCRVSDLLTDPPAATRRQRVPAWLATGGTLLLSFGVLRGLVPEGVSLALAAFVALALTAAADVSVAVRRGWRTRIGARAAVHLGATLVLAAATVATGGLPATTLLLLAVATGVTEAATAAITGLKSLRWHAAARDAGLLTGEIRPFREAAETGEPGETADEPHTPAARPGTSPIRRRPSGGPARTADRPANRASVVGRARVVPKEQIF